METQWRQRGKGGAVLACLIAIMAPGVAASLDLRVQGRSQLDATATAAGTHLLVRGDLRDDLNQPLPQRRIGIAVYDDADDSRVATRTSRTDRLGKFATQFDLSPGRYRVTIRFESTTHVTGTVFDQTVEVERQPANLQVRGPSLVHGTEAPVHLSVTATIGGVGLSVPVEIRRKQGPTIRRVVDESGRIRVDISDLLTTGINDLEVVVPGDEHREEASASIAIHRVEQFDIEGDLEPVFERLQRGAAVDGRVRAGGEPVEGMRVVATMVPVGEETGAEEGEERSELRRFQESGETDASGRFHLFFGRERLSDGRWRASIRVQPEVGEAVSEQMGTVEIDRSLSRMIVNGAALLAVLALVVVVGREAWEAIRRKLDEWEHRRAETERRRRAFEEEQTLEAIPVADDEDAPSTEGDRRGFRGRVWDGWSDEPVDGATLRLQPSDRPEREHEETSDEQGRFEFGRLDRGSWELVVSARHYVRGRFSFDVPHDGSLANCRFELVPVPLKIRRLYQSLVELARGEDLWGRLSPREIRSAVAGVLEEKPPPPEAGSESAREFVRRIRELLDEGSEPSLRTPVDYLEALTDIVRETYFGPRRYDETTWELARELALRLRDELEVDDAA